MTHSLYAHIKTVCHPVTNTHHPPIFITESLQTDARTVNDSTVSKEMSRGKGGAGGGMWGLMSGGVGWMDAGADGIEW